MPQSIKARPTMVSRRPAAVERTQADKERKLLSAVEASVRMKRLTLDIPEELHRAIKRNAADEGVTMAEKLRGVLMEYYQLA